MPEDVVLHLPPAARPPRFEDGAELARPVAKKLRLRPDALAEVRVTRVSFDGRRGKRGWRVAVRAWRRGEDVPSAPATSPPQLARALADGPRVVVVGSGPAGLFAALELASAGARVHVLERGRDVRGRRRSIRRLNRGETCEPDSNYCFGEGGAGTYSDGKLYNRSGSKRDVRAVLETLVAHGAPPEILVDWRPHVGSNRLPEVVKALRETLRAAGHEVRFRTRVEELIVDAGAVRGVRLRDLETDRSAELDCDAVVLATGHSAPDALEMAARAGARLEAKGFAMGVRAEHPQPWLDARQYGGLREAHDLPAAFYELTTNVEERGVYSFCMCPGGFIVPTTTADERLIVNGMSLSRRDSPFANSGLVVGLQPQDWCGARGVAWGWPQLLQRAAALRGEDASAPLPEDPEDDPLFGVRLQEALETVAAAAGGGRHRAPAQLASHFLAGQPGQTVLPTSYRPGLTPTSLDELLPVGMAQRLRSGLATFDARLPGYASEIGQLVGVETRTSSPVRAVRDDETLQAAGVRGLWPAGEGAGYAGGIVSAAIDGRRVARALLKSLRTSD